MATKKATRKWRPSNSNPLYTQLDFRVLIQDADLVQDAVEAEAQRLGTPASRNRFLTRTVLAAAKKELARTR
jgi:hypothetical protein